QRATPLQQLVPYVFGSAPSEEAVATCTERGKGKARVRQVQAQEILPVEAGPDRLGGLAIGEVLPKLQDGHQGQAPGREARLADKRKQRGEVVVLKNGAESIPQAQVGITFRKGSTGHTGGVCRHRLQGVRA